MDIEEFLKVNIEGYLLNDLENMANYRKDPSKQYGELAYPMIISTIAGMELLGALLDPGKFDKYKGNEYFRHYWEQYLDQKYKNYKDFIDIVYQLARHGIAHVFTVKPGIKIVKNDSQHHLKYLVDKIDNKMKVFTIDSVEFYRDFKDSYYKHIKSTIATLRQKMQCRLDEMINCYQKQSADYYSKLPSCIKPILNDISSIPSASGVI